VIIKYFSSYLNIFKYKITIFLTLNLKNNNSPKHCNIKLTRAKLEGLTDNFLKRTVKPVENCLKDSGVPKDKIDEVILVGGMTRMPKVQKMVQDFFGKVPNRSVNPDEAVAIGAAIQGGKIIYT
jgi:molecular chaperone DnaK